MESNLWVHEAREHFWQFTLAEGQDLCAWLFLSCNSRQTTYNDNSRMLHWRSLVIVRSMFDFPFSILITMGRFRSVFRKIFGGINPKSIWGYPNRGVLSAEGRRTEAQSRVAYGVGCPIPSRLGCLTEHHEFTQRGPGQSRGRKCNLDYFKGHRTLRLAPICWCFELSNSVSGGKAEVCGNCPLPQIEPRLGGSWYQIWQLSCESSLWKGRECIRVRRWTFLNVNILL